MQIVAPLGKVIFGIIAAPFLIATTSDVASAQIADWVDSGKIEKVTSAPLNLSPPTLWRAPAAILLNNGPFVTGMGNGFAGANTSVVGPGSTVFGFTASTVSDVRLSDDFIIAGNAWQVDQITTFAYQTNSTTTSTFTAKNLRIWDGRPDLPGSSVVWGDLTTNVLTGSAWTGAYRVNSGTLTNNQRPVMANSVNVGTTLAPGTYWLEWRNSGSLPSGPFVPPVTTGAPTTGNAGQFVSGAWTFPRLDGAQTVEIPFLIDGSLVPGYACTLIDVVGQWGFTGSRCGDFTSNATSARYETAITQPIAIGSPFAYEVELLANRPRQPNAAASLFVGGSALPLQTATQNWNRGIAFNISHNGKFSIFRYNGPGLPAALQKWVVPAGVSINRAPASNVLRVEGNAMQPGPGVSINGGGFAGYSLNFFINGVLVKNLFEQIQISDDQFGVGFVRSVPTTGNLEADDWLEVLSVDDVAQTRAGGFSPQVVSAEQLRANAAANAQIGNDDPQFAPDFSKR